MSNDVNTGEAVMLPASYVQELLWLMDRASPGSSAYNVPRTRRLTGTLSIDALRRAFDALVARHEILRTTYAFHDEHPVQVIHEPRAVDFRVVDLSARPEGERVAEAERIAKAQATTPFDLASDQLMRVTVVKLADADHVLHIDSHHIAFDGWSRDVLFRELSALYREFTGGEAAMLPDLPIQYADYAIWEREHLSGAKLETLLDYWRKQLGDAGFVLELPTDYARPAVPGVGGVTERITLSPELLAGVRALARQHEATLYMTLLAAYTAVLHRYTGQSDVLVGSPIAGRSRPETEGLIGYFANTIVQRARFSSDPTFAELLTQVRASALGAYDNQEVPFEKLVLELQGGQQLSHSPLFQVVFTMLGGGSESGPSRIGQAEVSSFGTDDTNTKFDLTLFMTERDDSLALTLRARSDLYSAASARRILGHIRTVLESAVANPTTKVSSLPILTSDERGELAGWNETRTELGSPTTIDRLFAEQVARAPGQVAVRSGESTLSYAELDARANRVANGLVSRGVKQGDMVAVSLDRSVELLVAILGVLKAGAAYVPVMPDIPEARADRQVEECGAHVVLRASDVVQMSSEGDAVAPAIDADPQRVAYVLYTSGSTGVPKGVAVTHANVVHYARAVGAVLGQGASMSGWHFGMVSTLGADLGNTSLFPSLFNGGTLHIMPADVTTDPSRYASYVRAHPLDVLKITPNHLRALVGSASGAELAGLLPTRWIVTGGEALSLDFATRLLDAGSCRVLNHYGPTEATVGASTFEVTRESLAAARAAGAQTVPIGRPLANVQLHVLDARRRLAPVGVPGELYISGAGVARGYLGHADLTRERFVELAGDVQFPELALSSLGVARDDSAPSYKTGDRVRRLADGSIEFLGRADDQVKIRGYRVELGEIELAFAEHPAVTQCAVVARAADGDNRVVAYVVVRTGDDYAKAHAQRITPQVLQEWVATKLPEYTVPSAVVMLDAMPLSANGKIDRAALPDPSVDALDAADEFVAPRTATEEAIAAIWAEVLKKERVGVTENFITLGGHSLLAIRVLGKLSRKFGVRLPLRSLFDAPTIADLSELVDLEVQLAAVSALASDQPSNA
ncbi:MAG: amino acid adenylation domain-containing protein [Gemmatimonadaceae bacterium]